MVTITGDTYRRTGNQYEFKGFNQMAAHGGRRLGAGRKPAEIKPLGQKFFESIATVGELRDLIRARMHSKDEKVSSTAVFWVADHIWGKAKEPIEHDLAPDLKRSLIIDL